jgi:multiple sugar transport system permease protein
MGARRVISTRDSTSPVATERRLTPIARRREARLNRGARWGLILVAPAVCYFSLFHIYPLVWAAWISLQEYSLLGQPRFIGLDNYRRLLHAASFRNSIRARLFYTFGTVVPIWFIAFGLALIFNQRFCLRRLFPTIIYLPAVVSLTVWCLIFSLMYHPRWGLLTLFTDPLGFAYVR